MSVSADPSTPTLLQMEQLGLPTDGSVKPTALLVSADRRRCFVGVRSPGSLHENLGVVELDADGAPVGAAAWFADGGAPLPMGHYRLVGTIVEDPRGRCLYLGLNGEPVRPAEALVVHPLAGGRPTGKPVRVVSGHPQGLVSGIARHPVHELLYTVAGTGREVMVHHLDERGVPAGAPEKHTFGAQGKYELAIDAGGTRLYIAIRPDHLEVLPLDGEGRPIVENVETFDGRPSPGENPNSWFSFLLTPKALYRRPWPDSTIPEWPLAVWPLRPDGRPVGTPQVVDELTGRVFAVEEAASRVVAVADRRVPDAASGTQMVTGSVLRTATLDGDGLPGVVTETLTLRRRTAAAGAGQPAQRSAVLTTTLGTGVIGNEVTGWRVRVTPLELHGATGPVSGPVPWTLGIHNGTAVFSNVPLAAGQTSAWAPLDAVLARVTGQLLFDLQTSAASVTGVTVRVEVADAGATLRTMTDSAAGRMLCFVLPGYDVPLEGDRLSRIELLSEHAVRMEQEAAAVAVPEAERPAAFPVSCLMVRGPQGHLGQLSSQVRTVRQLGINTAMVTEYAGLTADQVDEVLQREGLTRRATASSHLLAMFDFDTATLTPEKVKAWAVGIVNDLAAHNGARPEDIIDVKMADEPVWYWPSVVNQVRANPAWVAAFRSYLQSKGLTPGDVGAAGWDEVLPIPRGAVTAEPATRRLFLHTVRFLAEAATGAARLHRDALRDALGASPPRFLDVNTNNHTDRWYFSSPGKSIANNPDNDHCKDPVIGPSLAMAGFDWLHSGRTAAYTPFSMDIAFDPDPQHCSFLGDALRSAAAAGGQEFGAYVDGQVLGVNEAGASYKVLSLIGHGAKLLDVYCFGPRVTFHDGWSDMLRVYRPLARALGTVGRSDGVLARGRRARGTVALLSPGISNLWDGADSGLYLPEVESLHTALVHRGYTVDVVDEHDLEHGALGRYDVLYLTGINLPLAAQRAVADWVAAGGTLAVTPGAATADELDRPATALDAVLGLAARAPDRFVKTGQYQADTVTFPAAGGFLGQDGDAAVPVTTPLTPLTLSAPGSAVVVATFGSGAPAVTVRRHGAGRAVAYGFFPGWHHRTTADRMRIDRVPAGHGAVQREAVVAPARLAATPRPVVTSVPGVEACRLDAAPDAVTVVLLNWTGKRVAALDVTVTGVVSALTVRSTGQGPLAATPGPDGLTVRLPLEDVDVLVLEGVQVAG